MLAGKKRITGGKDGRDHRPSDKALDRPRTIIDWIFQAKPHATLLRVKLAAEVVKSHRVEKARESQRARSYPTSLKAICLKKIFKGLAWLRCFFPQGD
jgi:hypothetical protein